jgi:translation initiation factor 1
MGLFDGTPLERPVVCEQCGKPEADCQCAPEPERRTAPSEQTLRLTTEKRRKGKSVTVVRGLVDEGTHLADVLTMLKTVCGAGGTVKDGEVEIQGRQLDTIKTSLTRAGYRVTE